ncbi:MAG: SGNH/GDSL hydrolase family protein [Polaromonas sp.]
MSALAGPFSSLFVFGDSLSDTGNLSFLTGGTQPGISQPYFNGRLSDGPLWVEGLATGLGLTGQAASVFAGGNNYAFAGARTGLGTSPPGVLAQAAGLWGAGNASLGLSGHSAADPNALYVVVGGGNDMRDARSVVGGTAATRAAAAGVAINDLANTIGFLASKGAKNILISTLPDLGFTPEAVLLGLTSESSDASSWFNGLIPGLMTFGSSLGLNMNLLDMAGLLNEIRLDPGFYGITNTRWPCLGFAYSAGDSCGTSLFSDVLHPSSYAHSLIASAALEVLGIPEPGSLALFGLAVLALAVVRRRPMVKGAL